MKLVLVAFLLNSRIARGDDSLYFDLNAPDLETFLSDDDFKAIASLDESQLSGNNSSEWFRDAMYNPELFEGDIKNELNATTIPLFINGGPKTSRDDDLQLNAIRDRRQLWKSGRIPYALSSQYSPHSRAIIAAAMDEYSKKTCIRFEPRTHYDSDYLYILPERGCYSMVGRTGGRQVLSLGQGCIQKGTIMHEMMHATGFFHEQSRNDRDNYVTVLWHNILPGMQNQFDKYSTATIQTLDTQYDYQSIMHYDPVAFSRNGQPTIVPKVNTQIGQRGGFSQLDAYKINRLYECTASGSTTIVSPHVITINLGTTTPLPTPSQKCVDKRPDCAQLASQGWCSKNVGWMNENCCGICDKHPTTNNGTCEDLRVDCPDLVKKRYCLSAPRFSKTYCKRACGYCFSPNVIDDLERRVITTSPNPYIPNTVQTLQPYTTTTAPTTTTGFLCRDKNYKCVHWKKLGYCRGQFETYMRDNCPFSCGHCQVNY